MCSADAGTVTLGETTLTGLAPHRIARAGIGRTFQTPSVPRGVSVLDVVASGRFNADRVRDRRLDPAPAAVLALARGRPSRRADCCSSWSASTTVADEEASSLSLGTRRLVEVARALCAKPGLLLLDEPASGLSDEEVEPLGEVITAAADAGATVVLIEHNFGFVSRSSDDAPRARISAS